MEYANSFSLFKSVKFFIKRCCICDTFKTLMSFSLVGLQILSCVSILSKSLLIELLRTELKDRGSCITKQLLTFAKRVVQEGSDLKIHNVDKSYLTDVRALIKCRPSPEQITLESAYKPGRGEVGLGCVSNLEANGVVKVMFSVMSVCPLGRGWGVPTMYTAPTPAPLPLPWGSLCSLTNLGPAVTKLNSLHL